jgi:hypothetical protein
MKHLTYIAILFFVLSVASCAVDEECRKDKFVAMKVMFYKKTLNPTTQQYTTSTLIVDSLTVQGIGVDSVLYNNKKSISQIFLPLHKFQNESRFAIRFNNITDTLTILHTNYDFYLSLECGCIKTHSIDTVLTTNHFVDSIRIPNHNINTFNAEHLQIYN